MALITSAASGNFSAGATWTGGVVPGVGDEARASTGHTVTIDVNTTCDLISTAGTGTFVINSAVTLTANVLNSGNANTRALTCSHASPDEANIVGNISGGTQTGRIAVRNSGTGTLNITGNIQGGITNSWGLENTFIGIVNITGDCTSISNASTGTINVTGRVYGGGITGTLAVSGAENQSTGTLTVIGTIEASHTAAGVAGTNAQQLTVLSGPFLTETTRGVAPVYCLAWRWNASPSNSTYLEVMTNDLLVKRSLYTADNITGMPNEADVKDGVVYGPSSELTGTFEQTVSPSATDIRDAVWGAATTSLTTAGSIGERLKNCASVDSTGTALATALTAPAP
jgi:hypothetical protein